MTDKEIDQAWDYLGEACYWCNPIIHFKDLPNNLQQEAEELHNIHAFLSMMSSVLAYDFNMYYSPDKNLEDIAIKIFQNDSYARKAAEPLDKTQAVDFAKDMIIDYIDNAQIIKNVHTDSDGLSYNSVRFKDRPISDVGRDFLARCKHFNLKVKELADSPDYQSL